MSHQGATSTSSAQLARDTLTVEVPATSANVGVGFDCLGLALDLMARFSFAEPDRKSVV